MGTTRSRPPFEKAEVTAEVMVFSRPAVVVLFLKIGTATVLMWPGRLPRKLYPQPVGRQAARTSRSPTTARDASMHRRLRCRSPECQFTCDTSFSLAVALIAWAVMSALAGYRF